MFNEDLTESQLVELHRKETELLEQKSKLELRVSALSAEVDALRKDMQLAFRKKYEPRFSDINYKHALIGGRVKHTIKISDIAEYYVTLPSGKTWSEVAAFRKTAADLTEAEYTLLAFLVGATMTAANAPTQDFSTYPLDKKLEVIRSMSTLMVQVVADECASLQAWLNVVLELELGNS